MSRRAAAAVAIPAAALLSGALAVLPASSAVAQRVAPPPAAEGTFRPVPLGTDGRPVPYGGDRGPSLRDMPAAELRLLDKMTGTVETFRLSVGETRSGPRIEITLNACRTTLPGAPEEAAAHLTVRDRRDPAPRFEGWMFSASPALSALDHARYDVWVLSCSTVSAEASSGSE